MFLKVSTQVLISGFFSLTLFGSAQADSHLAYHGLVRQYVKGFEKSGEIGCYEIRKGSENQIKVRCVNIHQVTFGFEIEARISRDQLKIETVPFFPVDDVTEVAKRGDPLDVISLEVFPAVCFGGNGVQNAMKSFLAQMTSGVLRSGSCFLVDEDGEEVAFSPTRNQTLQCQDAKKKFFIHRRISDLEVGGGLFSKSYYLGNYYSSITVESEDYISTRRQDEIKRRHPNALDGGRKLP